MTCIALVSTTAVANADVWWANYGSGRVGHSNTDGTDISSSFITARSMASGVAVNSEYVYWANGMYEAPGSVGRARRDGSGADNDFINRSNFSSTGIGDIAVDETYIYFSQPNIGKIGRAKLDGTDIRPNFISGLEYHYGIAVDAEHVYWADQSRNSVGRANIDGTSVNRAFITGADDPLSVAVDANHVYWNNWNTSTIGRANIDGTSINQAFVATGSGVVGVAVDSEHIYWTCQYETTIGRANIDGTNAKGDWMATGANNYNLEVDRSTSSTSSSSSSSSSSSTSSSSTTSTSTSTSTTLPPASSTTIDSSTVQVMTSTPTTSPIPKGEAVVAQIAQKALPRLAPTPTTQLQPDPTTSTTVATIPILPTTQTGEAKSVVNGVVENAVITRRDNSMQIDTTVIDAVFSAYSSDGDKLALDVTGSLRVSAGDIIEADATGFSPGTEVQVWLNSTPTLLGSFEVTPDGRVTARVDVPAALATGKHRVSLVGTTDGGSATLTAGILAGAIESNGFNMLLIIPLSIAMIIAITVPTTLRQRRRR